MSVTKVHSPMYRDYDEYLDDNGNKFYRNKDTGETLPSVSVEGPLGILAITPEQQEKYKQRKEREKTKEATREYNRGNSFYFALARDRRNDGLSPQALARLFFAATYLRYGTDVLYSTSGTPLRKAELQELMRLKPETFKSFWREVSGKYIFQADGLLKMSREFIRGTLRGWSDKGCAEAQWQQVYIKPLRELFWQTPVKKHRYLGLLFMLLPWVSWEFNILCWNPEERDRNKIEPMTLDDFCKSMGAGGYNENQRSRLLDAYRALDFTMGSHKQRVCAYLEDHISGQYYFVLNPNLVYRGSDRAKVEGFGTFFPDYIPAA